MNGGGRKELLSPYQELMKYVSYTLYVLCINIFNKSIREGNFFKKYVGWVANWKSEVKKIKSDLEHAKLLVITFILADILLFDFLKNVNLFKNKTIKFGFLEKKSMWN